MLLHRGFDKGAAIIVSWFSGVHRSYFGCQVEVTTLIGIWLAVQRLVRWLQHNRPSLFPVVSSGEALRVVQEVLCYQRPLVIVEADPLLFRFLI